MNQNKGKHSTMQVEMREVQLSGGEWNKTLLALGEASLLQSYEWGQVKQRLGWRVIQLLWHSEDGVVQAAALVLEREQRVPFIGRAIQLLYAPKGPLMNWHGGIEQRIFGDLQDYARERGAVYLKCDPDLITARGFEGRPDFEPDPQAERTLGELIANGWRISRLQVQFRNTFVVDLNASEDELLAAMKQKTRYNIRLAEKKGVEVRIATTEDLGLFYDMYLETSDRDNFIIRPREYYLNLWGTFMSAGMATPLLAGVGDEAVAGLILFHFGKRSWYLYGMSRDIHREKMPNYLLQWKAMLTSKSLSCCSYDLWGAPDEFNESDRMWGVYKFKEGLGGRVVQTPGALDYPARPFEYTIIQVLLPKIQNITRALRRRQIRQEITD